MNNELVKTNLFRFLEHREHERAAQDGVNGMLSPMGFACLSRSDDMGYTECQDSTAQGKGVCGVEGTGIDSNDAWVHDLNNLLQNIKKISISMAVYMQELLGTIHNET